MSNYNYNYYENIDQPIAEVVDSQDNTTYTPVAGVTDDFGVIAYPNLGGETKTNAKLYNVNPDIAERPGENPYFKTRPAVDIASYPKRSTVLKHLEESLPDFSLAMGFDTYEPKHNETYYHVAETMADNVYKWLSENDDEPTMTSLAIDNSLLLVPGTKTAIVKDILDSKAVKVPANVWEKLMEWFGGGPQICLTMPKARKIFHDNSGKLVRVICTNDLEHYVRFFFHPGTKVYAAKAVICEYFQVEIDNARMHDFYKFRPFSRMDETVLLKTELKERHLMHDNAILLELADENGDFHVTHSNRRAEVQLNNHIEGIASSSTKGVVGLKNLGNTCYMNSILQCLSNVPLLKDEFISERYKNDINLTNALGYKGKMAEAFAELMKIMWSGGGTVVGPNGFRRVLTEAKTDFRGYEQHDSQEFLSELLDALHEDLNRVKNKPITETVQKNGRPDEVVAAEAFEMHKLRHNSVISDLFTGLYKSTVSCPDEACGNVSVTFDPFMVLPLPLQTGEKPYHVVNVLFVPINPRETPKRVEVVAPRHGPCFLLKEIIKEKMGLSTTNRINATLVGEGKAPEINLDDTALRAQFYNDSDTDICAKHDLMMFRVDNGKVLDIYANSYSLSNVSPSSVVMAFEVYNAAAFEKHLGSMDKEWERRLDTIVDWRRIYNQKRVPEVTPDDTDYSDTEDITDLNFIAHERATHEVVVGYENCPIHSKDVWFGNYNFLESAQKIRMEFLLVEKCSWGQYTKFQKDNNNKFGYQSPILQISKEEFSTREVYVIRGIVDTKERPTQHNYRRGGFETAFEVGGLYVVNETKTPMEVNDIRLANNNKSTKDLKGDDKESEKKSQGSTFVEKNVRGDKLGDDELRKKENPSKLGQSKRGFNFLFGNNNKRNKKSVGKVNVKDNIRTIKSEPIAEAPPIAPAPSTRTEKPLSTATTVQEETCEEASLSPHERADKLKAGDVEEAFTSGSLVLFPDGRRKNFPIGNTYHFARAQDDESREPMILEGNVDSSGRFLWGKFRVELGFAKGEFFMERVASRTWEKPANKGMSDHTVAKTRYSVLEPQEDQVLIILAHKSKKGYTLKQTLPDVFLIPEDAANLDVCEIIKSKFKAYLEEMFKDETEESEVSRESSEKIQRILETVVIRRSSSKYDAQYYNADRYKPEMLLDDKSDQKFKRNSRDGQLAWIICEWPEDIPFVENRPSTLMEVDPTSSPRMDLSKALDLFSRKEKLNAMNEWYCGKCKTHQQAYKRLQLWSLPTVLVIQFKRFSQDEGRSTADKLEIPVDFPFDLDLKDFTLSYQLLEEKLEDRNVAETVKEMNEKLADFQYSLVAVSSHVGGGLGFGHYIACAKNEVDGKWYEYNDKIVTPIEKNWEKIVNPEAYVLFYVRKKVMPDQTVTLAEVDHSSN